MYGVATYLKMVKKGATISEILEFIGGLFFVPLKGGIGGLTKDILAQACAELIPLPWAVICTWFKSIGSHFE